MTRPWAIGSASLLTIILHVPVISARGAPIDVTVTSDKTTLHLNLALNENLTSLPVANIYVDSSNASMLEKPIAQAVQKLVPTATISNLTLRARTFNSSGSWLQEENYTLVITGINTNTGGVIRSEVAFLTMSILYSVVPTDRSGERLVRWHGRVFRSADPRGTLDAANRSIVSLGTCHGHHLGQTSH